jgi:hypothetical protein
MPQHHSSIEQSKSYVTRNPSQQRRQIVSPFPHNLAKCTIRLRQRCMTRRIQERKFQDKGPAGGTWSDRQAMPPACERMEAPLKQVVMMRVKSLMTGVPSRNWSFSGTTVQPSRTPVKPAYLENEHVSIATCITRTRSDGRLGAPPSVTSQSVGQEV